MQYSSYGKLDSRVAVDGDAMFLGIDMRDQAFGTGRDRSMLQPGMLARAENKRLKFGSIDRRLGTSFPGDFNPTFTNTLSGSTIYNNPNGDEVMLVAQVNANFVWQLQFGKDPIQVPIAAGATTGTGLVNFVQAFDKVVMCRPGLTALQWDGLSAGGFAAFAAPVAGRTGTAGWAGTPFENRVLYYYPNHPNAPYRDQLIASDALTYNQYLDPSFKFRINAGESSKLTCVAPYFKGAVVCFMTHSIHMLQDFTVETTLSGGGVVATGPGGAGQLASQRLLNDRLNGIGLYLPCLFGSDLIFLSRPAGFYKLSQIVQDQIAAEPTPISGKIQPLIDRINWSVAAGWACSAVLGDYCYFAAPRDDAGRNNMIMVYNGVSNEWESAPDYFLDPTFCIDRLLVTYYNNAPRLFALDYVNSRIYLLYDGMTDEINGDSLPVHDVWETRGYICGDAAAFKQFTRAKIGVRTLDPDAVITSVVDGVNEEKQIGIISKDRLDYYIHGKAPFNAETDDPNAPFREDYTVEEAGDFIGDDFDNLPIGNIGSIPAFPSYTMSEQKQATVEPFSIHQNGRWVSIRGEGNGGITDILGVEVEAIPSTKEGVKTLA
jgi:hypothetical protein